MGLSDNGWAFVSVEKVTQYSHLHFPHIGSPALWTLWKLKALPSGDLRGKLFVLAVINMYTKGVSLRRL